jgi:HK97 family phage portal protein
MTTGQTRIIAAENMLHVPLTTWDGIVGMSPILQAKQTLGMAVASERFGNRFFANYAMPQMALLSKKVIKPEDKHKMRRDWERLQSGANQHRVAVIDQEMDLKVLSVTPEEAQFLEQRRYTRADIGALFKIPLHYLGDNTKLANASVEGQNLSFVVDTLRPYIVRLEAEITRKLLKREPGSEAKLTVSFDVSERLRGDSAAQAAWATAGRNGGWLSANDVRRAQGLNEGGPELNVYLAPVNYQNAEKLLDPAPPVTQEVAA